MSFWKVGLLEISYAGGESGLALVGVVIDGNSDRNRGQGRTDKFKLLFAVLRLRLAGTSLSIRRPMPFNSCVVSVIENLHAN